MEMKICSYGAGHMTKMATMPIYGKNHSKIFFIFLVDPGVTLTYFTARSYFVT